jgi:hypothetical protein
LDTSNPRVELGWISDAASPSERAGCRLKKLHGAGPKALRLLQDTLERHGLSLG